MILLGVELIKEMVETVILTGRVKGFAPVSLLLIAAPESGKTSVVLERPCKAALALTDVTGKGIQEICKLQPSLSHIIINDMVAVMAHKQTVNRFTLSMLNAITEEGIQAVAYPGSIQNFANGRRGVIACLTTDLANDGRSWWNKIGFTSRMVPFCFEHSEQLTIRIKESIDAGVQKANTPASEFVIPELPINVKVDPKHIREIRRLADVQSERLQEKGYRRLKQYHCLARAHAIRRGNWKNAVVNESDVDFLRRLQIFVSYTEPGII